MVDWGLPWGRPTGVDLGDGWRMNSSHGVTSSGSQEKEEWGRKGCMEMGEAASDVPWDPSFITVLPLRHPPCSDKLRATQVLISTIQNISKQQPSWVLAAMWFIPLFFFITQTYTLFLQLLPTPMPLHHYWCILLDCTTSSTCHSLLQGTGDPCMHYP